MHSLNNRLKRLQALLKDKQQAQVTQTDADLTEALRAKYAAMPDDQLLAEYEAWKADVIAHPDPKFDGMNAQELIKDYMANL